MNEDGQGIERWGVTYDPGVFEILRRKFLEWGIQLVASNFNCLKDAFKEESQN